MVCSPLNDLQKVKENSGGSFQGWQNKKSILRQEKAQQVERDQERKRAEKEEKQMKS